MVFLIIPVHVHHQQSSIVGDHYLLYTTVWPSTGLLTLLTVRSDPDLHPIRFPRAPPYSTSYRICTCSVQSQTTYGAGQNPVLDVRPMEPQLDANIN